MNSSLSILLRWRPHRILSKMMTTQTLNTFQVPKMKTTNSSNIVFFRKQPNLFYSTLPEYKSDLMHLCVFLLPGVGRDKRRLDLAVPVIDRLTRFKSVETLISDLQSRGALNDSNINYESFSTLLTLLCYANKNKVLIDAYHHMVKSHGFVPNTFALNLLVDSLFKTSQPQVALTVLEQVKTRDNFTFEIPLFHFSDLNDITNLSIFLRSMLNVPYYPLKETLNMLLIFFCKMKDDKNDFLPQVYQLLGLKVKLGHKFSIDGWTSIIRKCCEFWRLDDATKFFFSMTKTDCSSIVIPVTHHFLIHVLLDSNEVDGALRVLVATGNEGIKPAIHSFSRIVTALCEEGRMDVAVTAYRLIALWHPRSDIHYDNYIPIMIMSELIKAGMNDKAATVLTLAIGEL